MLPPGGTEMTTRIVTPALRPGGMAAQRPCKTHEDKNDDPQREIFAHDDPQHHRLGGLPELTPAGGRAAGRCCYLVIASLAFCTTSLGVA